MTGFYNRDGLCVYCAVRTESLNIVQALADLSLGHEVSMRNILLCTVALGHVSDPVLRFSPVSIIPTMLQTHLYAPSVVRRAER